MESLIIKEFQGSQVRFEMRDGRLWGCLTDMAMATGKRVNNYLRLKNTIQLIDVLQNDVNQHSARIRAECQNDVISVEESRGGGTWGVEEISIDFGYWCNIQFRLWVISVIKEISHKGGYISPSATSEQLTALQTEIVEQQERIALLEDMHFEKRLVFDYLNATIRFKAGGYLLTDNIWAKFTKTRKAQINKLDEMKLQEFISIVWEWTQTLPGKTNQRPFINKGSYLDLENATFTPDKQNTQYPFVKNIVGE